MRDFIDGKIHSILNAHRRDAAEGTRSTKRTVIWSTIDTVLKAILDRHEDKVLTLETPSQATLSKVCAVSFRNLEQEHLIQANTGEIRAAFRENFSLGFVSRV